MRLIVRQIVTAIALVAVFATFAACRGRGETSATGSTETIAPADPQPAPNGTDAMTQTVDVETGRSEAEGGEAPVTTATTATSATVTDTAATAAPPPTTTTR